MHPLAMTRFLYFLTVAAIAVSCDDRAKRQWFGNFWGAAVQPVVHTASVQQPVVTQEVQQPVFQTVTAAPIVQHHTSIVDQPVFKHVQHTVAVPTPVVDPNVITPKIIVPKPSKTDISVIQRAKRQFWDGGLWGSTVAVAPAAHVHTNVVAPPLVQQVVRPVVHTQVVQPVVHTHSTVLKPVVHEVHSNIYVPQPVHIKPTIIEPEIIQPEPSNTKISVVQRAKRQVLLGSAPFGSVYPQYGYPAALGGYYGYPYGGYPYGFAAPVAVGPSNSKVSIVQSH